MDVDFKSRETSTAVNSHLIMKYSNILILHTRGPRPMQFMDTFVNVDIYSRQKTYTKINQ